MATRETIKIGVDTGGTFTDLVILRRGRLEVRKVFSRGEGCRRSCP